MSNRVRQRDRQAGVQTQTGQGTQEIVKLCILREDCQCDVSADGGQKANNHQEGSLTHQTLPRFSPCKADKTQNSPQHGSCHFFHF